MENNYDKNMEALLKKAFLSQDLQAAKNEKLLAATSGSTLGKSTGMTFFSTINLFKGALFVFTALGVLFGLGSIFKSESRYVPIKLSFETSTKKTEGLKTLPTLSFVALNGGELNQNIKKSTILDLISSDEEVRNIKVYEPEKQPYEVKVLSDEVIKSHSKDKEQFIKSIVKLDKKKVAQVEMQIQLNGNEQGLTNLSIWKTEVTNSEYRLFLNDLIIKNRNAEYDLAKVNETGWTEAYPYAFNKPMDSLYFKHPAYDNYPVVNVPLAGVELFCDWLTQEIRKIEKNKFLLDSVRIPTEIEWEFIASSGGAFDPYPWGGSSIRNSDGKYLANFRPLKGDFVADGAMFTALVDSYDPNKFGLYNISGNASELVFDSKAKKFGVKGGSWFDAMEYLKIKQPTRFLDSLTSHPTIGFRPVITFLK